MTGGTHYTTLGIERAATLAEIRKAYRSLARRLHPDVNASHDAADSFLRVQAAYAVLSDSKRRAEYDLRLESQAVASPGVAHYTWTNIATHVTKPNAARARTELDDMYDAYFGGREA
ncbi:MAG: J domain-containing protein [Phycisphaeraceae bacterium]|nr:J domain-containing protein [Phycisphaeraceae bacterium]